MTDSQQAILVQHSFYGITGGAGADGTDFTQATNARAVSVWPAANPLDTRVVICGETFDARLPFESRSPLGRPAQNAGNASGFIAVYNGNLDLMWTHHLFGSGVGQCAVTDVSVRVVFDNGVPVDDLITYCGISSHGSPGAGNASLSPIQPFDAAISPTCPGAAIGDTDNGAGQWDGFVGRISRDHAAATQTAIDFHSVVGGSSQDGLFGICELPNNRFVVVGSTAGGRSGIVTGPGANLFPFLKIACPGPADSYCMGTVQLFDATATPGNRLILVSSGSIGVPGASSTCARDVVARAALVDFQQAVPPVLDDAIFVVGSTDDGNLFSATTPVESYAGGADGFLQVLSAGGPLLIPEFTTYRGGPGDDGLTGVNAWTDYVDQVAVTGFRRVDVGATTDFDVASYLIYSGGFNPAVDLSLRPMRSAVVGGFGNEFPAAMGALTATGGLAFLEFGLGSPAGGGIAQGPTGRVNVVGTILSVDLPVLGGRPRSTNLPPPSGQAGIPDAVRAVLDLLPLGVGRTDGTRTEPVAPTPPFPRAGADGGTTPPCALTQFGAQLGLALPPAHRLLIDYEGPDPAGGTNAGIVVVRSPATTSVLLAALQIGFPGVAGNPLLLPDGAEIWTQNGPVVLFYAPTQGRPFRDVIPNLPSSATFTVQVAFGVNPPIPAGNVVAGIPCAGTTSFLLSPALWVSY